MLNLPGSAAHVCLLSPQVRLLNLKFSGQIRTLIISFLKPSLCWQNRNLGWWKVPSTQHASSHGRLPMSSRLPMSRRFSRRWFTYTLQMIQIIVNHRETLEYKRESSHPLTSYHQRIIINVEVGWIPMTPASLHGCHLPAGQEDHLHLNSLVSRLQAAGRVALPKHDTVW